MAYADYSYYQKTYHGRVIAPERWAGYAVMADAYIDAITQNRLHTGAAVTDAVRLAVCAVADVYANCDTTAASIPAGIKSENTDGYSVAYQDSSALLADHSARLLQAVRSYLPPSDPLRYRGVSHGL